MYLFFVLNHPAHYHLFKHTINELISDGHECEIFIRPKDVLEKLLDDDGIVYHKLSNSTRNKNWILWSSVWGLIKKDIELSSYIRKRKPDLLIGTDWAITNVGRIFGIPSVVLNEDDTKATPENRIFYPMAKTLMLPDCCDKGLWGKKRISYAGYHELAYLHPKRFQYNSQLIGKFINFEKPYIIIRLVKLTASHDKGKRGLGYDLLDKIIEKSKGDHQIFISFEGEIITKYEQYNFKFNPVLMHHFLTGAKLVIGDSQTMIAEAAVLGTPAIRFNDFVGKLSYLDELENKYELSFGFKTNEQEKFLLKIEEILKTNYVKKIWRSKLEKFYQEKIDVTAFIVWFIENYPNSVRIIEENQNYQYNFR